MVVVHDHQRTVTVSGERFINGVIDHFVHHVMQTRTVVGITDVHTRPLANSVQSAKDFNAVCAVFVLLLFCHSVPLCPASSN